MVPLLIILPKGCERICVSVKHEGHIVYPYSKVYVVRCVLEQCNRATPSGTKEPTSPVTAWLFDAFLASFPRLYATPAPITDTSAHCSSISMQLLSVNATTPGECKYSFIWSPTRCPPSFGSSFQAAIVAWARITLHVPKALVRVVSPPAPWMSILPHG